MITLKNVFDLIVDNIFPPRCAFCEEFSKSGICNNCIGIYNESSRNKKLPIPRKNHEMSHIQNAYAPFWYDEHIQKIVRKIKFHGELNLVDFCAKNMKECLPYIDNIYNYDIIISVPTKGYKKISRDDIPKYFAKRLSKATKVPFNGNALIKAKKTQTQSYLKPQQRLENVRGAFMVKHDIFSGKRVLLVDDVFTTGATANECAKAVMKNKAHSCDVICFAASYKF